MSIFNRNDIFIISATSLSIKAALEVIQQQPAIAMSSGAKPLEIKSILTKSNGGKTVVVVGGSETSFYLCRRLTNLGHTVIVIEKDESAAQRIAQEIVSENLQVIIGDGCDSADLRKTLISQADIFVALTGNDPDNLIACQMAKKLGAGRTVARMKDSHNRSMFADKVDVVVDEIATLTERIFSETGVEALEVMQHLAGQIDIIRVTAEDGSDAIGKSISQIFINALKDCTVGIILRNGKGVPVCGDVIVQQGDQLIIFATPKHKEALQQIFQKAR